MTDLSKNAGDRLTYQLQTIPTGVGRGEGETQEGNEEALSIYTDNLTINQIRHAVKVQNQGTIDQKRVGFNLREEAKAALTQWNSVTIEIGVINTLAGNTAASYTSAGRTYSGGNITKGTANNTPTAPTTNRNLIAGGQANENALTSSDTFTLGLVDAGLELANTTTAGAGRINPIMHNGQEKYICLLSYEQYLDMKRDNTSAIQWFDIQLAGLQGGQEEGKNGIYNNAVGEYAGVIFHVSHYLPLGQNCTATVANTKRALFLGKGAGAVGFGNGGVGEAGFRWAEKDYDYDEALGIQSRIIWGANKTVFNSEDAGVVTLSSYAAAHTS
jgi:N4-gp56 family major capsid protein